MYAIRSYYEKVDLGDTVQPGKELARIYGVDALEIPVSLTDRDISYNFV